MNQTLTPDTGKPDVEIDYPLSALGQRALQQLMQVWFDFERQLGRVPIVARIDRQQLSREDYLKLLLHLRQQVIEGGRWISRCASSFERDYADVRSTVIGHAQAEHQDFQMLEQDYLAAGGDQDLLHAQERNIGTEALHAFLMYRASQPNPVALIGAMWIIEGLGQKMAGSWADAVDRLFGSDPSCSQFMRYHALNDDGHMDKLYRLIDRVCQTEAQLKAVVKTARVVSRLYALQLEEIDHD